MPYYTVRSYLDEQVGKVSNDATTCVSIPLQQICCTMLIEHELVKFGHKNTVLTSSEVDTNIDVQYNFWILVFAYQEQEYEGLKY